MFSTLSDGAESTHSSSVASFAKKEDTRLDTNTKTSSIVLTVPSVTIQGSIAQSTLPIAQAFHTTQHFISNPSNTVLRSTPSGFTPTLLNGLPLRFTAGTALSPGILSSSSLSLLSSGLTIGGAQILYSPSTIATLEQTLLAEIEKQKLAAAISTSRIVGSLKVVSASEAAAAAAGGSELVSGEGDMPVMSMMSAGVKREYEDDSTYDDSTSDSDGGSGRGSYGGMAGGEGAVDYSVSSSGYSNVGGVGTPNGQSSGRSGPRRATGPRKDRSHEKLTPEEVERRLLRRERNKHAAAKCRQKRVDQTNLLLEETQVLETEQSRLHDEIKSYEQEKEELEFILEAHRLHCGVQPKPMPGIVMSTSAPTVSHHQPSYTLPIIKLEGGGVITPKMQVVEAPSARPHAVPEHAATRPSTLVKSGEKTITLVTEAGGGVSVFNLGLDSMIDGHTGLTPITGMPAAVPLLATPSSTIIGHLMAHLGGGGRQGGGMEEDKNIDSKPNVMSL